MRLKPTAVSFALAALAISAAVLGAQDAKSASAPSPAPTKGGRGASLDEIFAQLDRDHDGRISREEATGAFADRFAQWDADGDGFATRQEIHDYRLRFGLDDNGQRITPAAPVQAQRPAPRAPASATLLKEPADWRLETMTLPPGFAPDVKLKGTEEIRFAPGMFDTTSASYFTCVLALVADGVSGLGAADLKDFLEAYYRGLSASVGRRSGAKPDPAQMVAVVNPAPGTEAGNRFLAQVGFFDTFSDGRKITLNVEAAVFPQSAQQRTNVILLVSPSPRDSAAWTTLREIGRKAEQNAAPAPPAMTREMKWHPGHYAFVQSSPLDERHLYRNFLGIQKTYTWSALEPEHGRYDFSAIRADLAFLGRHGKRLVVQVQTKTFGAGQNYCPAYVTGPEYGGGVYRTRWGSFNPIIWNDAVNRRLNALYTQLGRELDGEPYLEAVVIPESATTFENAERQNLRYTSEGYTRAVEAGMQAARDAFPTTVVIQYVNMPPESIQALADYSRAHGIGFGGPDIYPFDPVLNDPQRGVYRLYAALADSVPLGAAVQQNDYTQKAAFRGGGGETPVKEIYEFGRDRLHLNYIFWGTRAGYFEKVQAMMADASFPQDPAGGLNTTRPKGAAATVR